MSRLVYVDPKRLSIEEDGALLRERERQINDIHRDMVTINELFSQMSTLVEAQAPDIIQVNENIASSAEKVEKGVEELQTAYDSKRLCSLL